MQGRPKVSVCMITYNHAPYIAQALEGILGQRVPFAVEVVIGEDCSTDGTRDIVESYQRAHPNVIRLLRSDGNIGMQANCHRTLSACRGEYVAFCEGDDYWTNPEKLVTQVAFLDTHQDYSLCCHNIMVHYESRLYDDYPYYPTGQENRSIGLHNRMPGETTGLNTLMGGMYLQAGSLMARNVFDAGLPAWSRGLAMADWIIALLAAQAGLIHYDNRVMSVYRVHGGGVWSNLQGTLKTKYMIDAACAVRDNMKLAASQYIAISSYIAAQRFTLMDQLCKSGNRARIWPEIRQVARDICSRKFAGAFGLGLFIGKHVLPDAVSLRLFRMWQFAKRQVVSPRSAK